MKSSNRAATHILPTGNEDQQIEVLIEDGAGIILRQSTWTEGLGWCTQKTIRLDSAQLDDLHHAISVARQRLNRQRAANGTFQAPAQVIQLPTIA